MYNRIRDFSYKFFTRKKVLYLIFLFAMITFVVYITLLCMGKVSYHYPESEYQQLETTAVSLVSKHSLDFDTKFNYEITDFDSEKSKLCFKLFGEESYIIVNVYNYTKSNEYTEISRENGYGFCFLVFIVTDIIAVSLNGGVIGFIAILIILLSIWFVAYLLHQTIDAFKK